MVASRCWTLANQLNQHDGDSEGTIGFSAFKSFLLVLESVDRRHLAVEPRRPPPGHDRLRLQHRYEAVSKLDFSWFSSAMGICAVRFICPRGFFRSEITALPLADAISAGLT